MQQLAPEASEALAAEATQLLEGELLDSQFYFVLAVSLASLSREEWMVRREQLVKKGMLGLQLIDLIYTELFEGVDSALEFVESADPAVQERMLQVHERFASCLRAALN